MNGVVLAVVVLCLIPLTGCQHLVIDKDKLFRPGEISEIVGFLAGFGTTFAAVPDVLAMLRRRSSEGMNPRMGAFQVLWVYYGLLIASRPVILWNVIAVLTNFGTVGVFACAGKSSHSLRQRNDRSGHNSVGCEVSSTGG